jgi:hypothetical protein
MEKDFYHSDFEELIRDKADQYKMYPSEKVWKGIDRALRSRRRWYWTGFVLLLSGVSYFAVTDLMSVTPANTQKIEAPSAPKTEVTTAQLVPFTTSLPERRSSTSPSGSTVTSDVYVANSGDITAAFEIPLNLFPGNESAEPQQKAAFTISGLEPLKNHETYSIELSWPVTAPMLPASQSLAAIAGSQPRASSLNPVRSQRIVLMPAQEPQSRLNNTINWLEERTAVRMPISHPKRISWQLAFSPTVNYRKLTGGNGWRNLPGSQTIPMAVRINGDINKLVNHKPALGFELGTHGIMKLNKRISLKGGIQFNYSKYDIRAFRTAREQATIALNSHLGNASTSIVNYTDLRNFGGTTVQDLKNQYFQLSMPVGFEVRIFGDDRIQFNVASTIQPTYLLNRNTYLITTDLKNYTKEPSLVRRWNVNTGAEAYVSYTRGDVKWQVGPQFRYQLLSSYQNVYPIKEYLMEYGIKVGITKTIR